MLANESKADPRARRTLKLLQTAMTELLMEKEFSKISVQDITERAQVNRATFYDHFEDKYDLLNYNVREAFQERLANRLPQSPLLTMDNLRILTLTVCEFLGGFIGHCAPSDRRDDHFIMVQQVQVTTYKIILEWGVRSVPLDVPSAVSLNTIATMTSFAIFGAVMQWAQNGRKLSPERLTEQVVAVLTSGMGAYLVAPA